MVEGSETGPYMEQCHSETEQVSEITHHTEREIAPRDALYPTMRVLTDSKMQTTHHSKKSGMYEKAVKGDVTIKVSEHERITWEKEDTRSGNVGARQYKELDGTTPMISDAITANSDLVLTILRDVRNEFFHKRVA